TLSIRINNQSRLSGEVVKRASISINESTLWINIPPSTSNEDGITPVALLQEEKATRLFLKWIKTQAESYMSQTTKTL
ncbi:MAG: hypothetical protein ACPG3T_01835, partial [Pseudomonadales bacterium]